MIPEPSLFSKTGGFIEHKGRREIRENKNYKGRAYEFRRGPLFYRSIRFL
jgi:hypothetical protein